MATVVHVAAERAANPEPEMTMTIVAAISCCPADVIAALRRGHPVPRTPIRKRTVQRAIRVAQARGERCVTIRGTQIVW